VRAEVSKQSTSASSNGTKKGETWISKAVDIHASPAALYRAVSTADGLRGWWCKELIADNDTDGIFQLRFPSGHLYHIRLVKANAPSRAEWDVLDHNAWPEWVGTKLVFAIEQNGPESSKLEFQHVGLRQGCECYGVCVNAWGYLMGSLKDFLEKGKGGPV
jgi:uncharacterized protein YndB with AHSA1/START domain